MEENKITASEVLAASQNTNAAAENAAAVPEEKITLTSRMQELEASRFSFAAPKKREGTRGSLGLFDDKGGLLEVWTCSETVTAAIMAIRADTALTEEQKKAKANRYAYTLVLMWVTAKNGDVMQIVSESRDFSSGFFF